MQDTTNRQHGPDDVEHRVRFVIPHPNAGETCCLPDALLATHLAAATPGLAELVQRTVSPWDTATTSNASGDDLSVKDATMPGMDAPEQHACDTGHFDRSLCPEPCGSMHSYCTVCGTRQDACAHDDAAPNTPATDFNPNDLATLEETIRVLKARIAAVEAALQDAFRGQSHLGIANATITLQSVYNALESRTQEPS